MKIQKKSKNARLGAFAFILLFLSFSAKASFVGTYTIDATKAASGSNFQTFTSAVDSVVKYGVSGPVVFNVANGVYKEQVDILAISGTSSINTIIFQSASGDSSKVTLTYPSANAQANNYTLQIDTANYITFSKMTFQRTGSKNFGQVIVLNQSKGAKFLNDQIIGLNNGSFSAYLANVTNDTDNVFLNNYFLYGTAAIGAGGISQQYQGTGLDIENNIIDSFYELGVYTNNENQFIISKNIIENGSYTYNYGILLEFDSSFNVSKNQITTTAGYMGLYLYSCNSSAGSRAVIANNMIGITNSMTSGYGILMYYSSYINFYYNSVLLTSNSFASGTCDFYRYNFNNFGLMNVFDNIFMNKEYGYAVFLYDSTGADSMDYNDLYTNGAYIGEWRFTNEPALSDWQSASSLDANSISTNPYFKSNIDLHASAPLLMAGTPISRIKDDIDGDARSASTPDIGADEFKLVLNDAGVYTIDSPGIGICASKYNVYATLRNYGANSLTSATINWSINGTLQTAYKWTGTLASGINTPSINIGALTLTTNTPEIIKAWTSVPNGKTDGNPVNDTTLKTVESGLTGTYTIGGASPDFTSFTAAVNALYTRGLCGPVTFNVSSGIYNESLNFDSLPGSSHTNTVTFQSQANDSSKVVIESNSNYVITFSRASNFTFRELTIYNNGTSGAVYFENRSSNNKITHCVIKADYQYSQLVYIYGYGNPNDSIEISNCAMHGGGYGVYAYGNYAAPYEMWLTVTGNIIDSFSNYGVFAFYEDSTNINNNLIQSPSSTSSYGLYIYYPHGNLNINKNKILFGAGGQEGILFDYMPNLTSALISNNFISIGGSNTAYGFYAGYYSQNLDFVFNNINITSTNSGSIGLFNDVAYSTGAGIDYTDNNVVNTGGGYAVSVTSSSYVASMDFNNYYVPTSSVYLGSWSGTAEANLGDWQIASSMDANSVSLDPIYASATDLHPNASGIYHKGIPVSGINDDIDGIKRNASTPSIGASEFTPVNLDAGIIAVNSPSPGFCAGKLPINVTLKNYGTNTLTSVTIYLSINGGSPAATSWTGSLAQGNTQLVNLGSTTFSGGTLYTLQAYSSLPNGKTDGNTKNDTTEVTRGNGLSGTYTIGGTSPDYATFSAAVNDLTIKGLCASVIFNVRDGVYPEDITFNGIPGASSSKTVLFQSASGDSSKVLLQDSANATASSVVSINNTSWLTFKGITIQNQSNANTVVTMTNSSKITFLNNHIIAANNASCIYSNYNSGNSYITIKNNHISDGQYGIYMLGYYNAYLMGLDVEGNIVDSFQYYGIFGEYVDSIIIKHNLVDNSPGSGYGIYIYAYTYPLTSQNQNEISYNKVYMNKGGAGMFLYYFGTNPSYPGRIYNNFVSTKGGDGIDMYYGTYADIYDNNILTYGSAATVSALNVYTGGNTGGLNIGDNNMINKGGGYAYSIDYTKVIVSEDYNNFFTNGSILVSENGAYYSNLSGWQSASSLDANSLSVDPKYAGINDLHISNAKLWKSGTPVSYITTDIDGTIRNTTNPTIGAHEFVPPPNDLGAIALLSPFYGQCGDSSSVVKVEISNFGSLSQTKIPVRTIVSGAASATFTDTVASIVSGTNAALTYKTFLNTYSGGLFKFKIFTIFAKDSNYSNDTFYTTIFINKTSPQPAVQDNSNCSAASVKLFAYPSANDSVFWYTSASGGAPLHEGDTFTTPLISKTTSYYAQAAVPSHRYTTGPLSDAIGVYTNASTAGIRFNVSAPIVIDSITVYPNSSGNAGVTLSDSAGNPLKTVYYAVSVLFPNTSVRIPVGIAVGPGHNYTLTLDSSTTGGFYFNNSGASYPYSVANVLSITNTSNNLGGKGYYFGPYDLLVHTGSCLSPRIAVTAFIGAPSANLSLDASSSGKFKSGSAKDPDLICAGSTIIYDLKTNFNNSAYGTTWTILSSSLETVSGNTDTSFKTISPSSSTPGEFIFSPSASDIDSVYILKLEVKDLIKLCDTVINRYVFVAGPPKIGVSPVSVCVGASQIYADSINPAGATFSWNFGDGTTAATDSPAHTYKAAGLFNLKLTVQNAAGCSNSGTVTITVNTPPTANFGASTVICPQQAVQFSDSSTAATGDNINGWQYNFGDGSKPSVSQNPVHQYSAAGTDTVTLVVKSAKGCSASVTKEVKIQSGPVAGFTTNPVCIGDSTHFKNTSTAPVGIPSYWWDFGDGSNNSFSKSPVHLYALGTFTVRLAITVPGGCTDTFSSLVSVSSKPTALISSPSSACVNTSVPINDSSITSSSLNYSWNFGDGGTSTKEYNNHTYTTKGSYRIRLSITALGGCPDSTSKKIIINPAPTADFVYGTACVGSPVQFRDTSSGAVSYGWDFGDGSGTSTAKDPSYTYSAAGLYPVIETVKNSSGCTGKDTVSTNVNTLPHTSFSYSGTNKGVVTFNMLGTQNPTNTYSWDFGDSSAASTSLNPKHSYSSAGQYLVTLYTTAKTGCVATDTLTIFVTITGINNPLAQNLNLQIAPNPFKDALRIEYSLRNGLDMKLGIYDVTGKEITTLVNTHQDAGKYSYTIDAGKYNMGAGVYFLRIIAGNQAIEEKIIRIK